MSDNLAVGALITDGEEKRLVRGLVTPKPGKYRKALEARNKKYWFG